MDGMKKEIGERIKETRNKLGLTLVDLEEKTGITNSALSKIERGTVAVSAENLFTISNAMDVSIDWLMRGKEQSEKTIFFNENWESTSRKKILETFFSKTVTLTDENIQFMNTMAEKLLELDIYRNAAHTEKRPTYKNRGLVIKDGTTNYIPSEGFIKLPVVGRITAGDPVLAYENIEQRIAVPESLMGNSKDHHFLLQVHGDSMINVGIQEGDYVVARQQSTAENGEVVIAMTNENETTVKTFYKENTHIRLQPENDMMKPILLNDVKILGKVIAVYRTST